MIVRDGIYLEDNPPARSQFRVGRRDPVRSVIVVHTAEPGKTDLEGPDPTAEAVASFIRRRSTAGSYHLLGDADSIIQLVRFENEAFHDRTGSNRWAIGISLAMNAADWPTLPPARRDAFLRTGAWMARMAADWLQQQGLERPEARLLTKQESDQPDASGFISHARRDPSRRSDPGKAFPWQQFFELYNKGDNDMPTQPDRSKLIDQWQRQVADLGFAHDWETGVPVDPSNPDQVNRYADGDFGATTLEDSLTLGLALDKLRNSVADPQALRDAKLWRRFVTARSELTALQTTAERQGAG